ncbi:hypothetical protein [Paenibacillus sp. UNC451MF]|uniref:hypothetical protein n=1 Tax=Paenibacillus sp. UNC451MF TaxID=1449063 RepID=UPI000490C6E1|nr:hypothetical protein [Paenibacillus sp. UNC451MF]
MKRECIVHFKIISKSGTRVLRGLIYLEENQEPTLQDYEQCLKDCGHDVRIENQNQFIFKAFKPGEEYLIDVLEDYEDSHTRDRHAESLAKTFIKGNNPI